MSTLTHLNVASAKPGHGFVAKGMGGFTGKLQTAIKSNFHGLGALKNSNTAIATLEKQVFTKQSVIRGGGLEHHQAEALLHKIQHEAYTKGEHLDAFQKDALKKIVHHLAKPVIKHDDTANQHGITSLANTQNNKSTVKQVGDVMKVVHQGQTGHAAGGIASAIRKNNLSNKLNDIGHSSGYKPPSIKLSI